MILFQTPLSADQLRHLRRAFAQPRHQPLPLFDRLLQSFLRSPLKTGLALYFGLFFLFLSLYLIFS